MASVTRGVAPPLGISHNGALSRNMGSERHVWVACRRSPFIWECREPSRVKFFAWLLVQSRVHTRGLLLKKGIVSVAEVGCPSGPLPLETASHMMLPYAHAVSFWDLVSPSPRARRSQTSPSYRPLEIDPEVGPDFILLCCWHLWKARNAAVFRGVVPSLLLHAKCAGTMPSCGESVDAWLSCLRAPQL